VEEELESAASVHPETSEIMTPSVVGKGGNFESLVSATGRRGFRKSGKRQRTERHLLLASNDSQLRWYFAWELKGGLQRLA
jgi:hypothetical protein